jgi:hypothetical protein
MFFAVVTVIYTSISLLLGFVFSKLAINVIHNIWFSSLEARDKGELQHLASNFGAAVVGVAVLIACIAEDGQIFSVVKAFLWAMLIWQAFLWGLSLFLFVSSWIGKVIDRLTTR